MDFSFVDEITRRHCAAGDFPSAVALIFDGDGTLYRRAFGTVTADMWFDMASVSKLITTTLLLTLMEEGRLTPDDAIADHLPQAQFGTTTARRLAGITVRQIMTHTSGILPWFPFYADGGAFWTVLERALAGSEIQRGMVYSDLNFMLLAQVFTHETGLSLRDGLEQRLKLPLGIRGLTYGPIDPAAACPTCYGNQIEQEMCADRGLAFSHWRPDGTEVRGTCNDGNAYYYFGGASGHAGIFATADGMAQLGQFYLTTRKPFFVEAMETRICDRGLGFDRDDVYPEGCGHSGFTGTSLWLSRTHNVGAVLLTNRLYRTDGKRPLLTDFRREMHNALLEHFPL
ncbi:MAG: serine hydrolase domain-containing protein [Pseudoflavonifractor sp.]